MNTVIQQLFFSACPGCQQEFPPGTLDPFCPECTKRISFFDSRLRCPGCGGENYTSLELCPQCLCEPSRPWRSALSVFAYRSFGRDLIRKFKFGNTPSLARPFAVLLSRLILSEFSNCPPDIIVPVPLHPLRYLSRGYNQAALAASLVADSINIPMVNALKRRWSFRRQAALNRSQRHAGLKNSFITVKSSRIHNRNILLLDDVLTTGATLSAAADSLIDSGAASVSIITIARSISFSPAALADHLKIHAKSHH